MTDYFVIAISYFIAFSPLIGLAVAGITGFVMGVTRPDWLVLAYLTVLLCNSQGGYGAIDGARSIYSRGTGQLFFPIVVLAIYGILATSGIWKAFGAFRSHKSNLAIAAWGFVALFFGNLIAATVLDVPIFEALSKNGFINVVHLCALVCVLFITIQAPRDLQRVEWIVLLCGAVRALYGLARFAFLGGDPANAYENYERLNVKLTYFDINDSLLASVVIYFCLRRLLEHWKDLRAAMRIMLLALVSMEVAVVALSYRRTAVAGLILVLVFLFVTAKREHRLNILFGAAFAMLPSLYFIGRRLDAVSEKSGRSTGFFYDLIGSSSYGAVSPRALELKYTLQTVLEQPFFGLGAWGRYKGSSAILWQQEGGFSFVHSGVLHLLLKTGFVGGALFVATVLLFCRFAIRARKELSAEKKLLFDTSLAGLLFSIPNFLIGTPIIETRTMLLLGFLIALPYIIHGIHAGEQKALPR